MTTFPTLDIPAIADLARRDAWVCWRALERKGKLTKVPHTPAGSPASSTDPRTWSSFVECWSAAFVRGDHDGIGRVTGGGRLVAIDLDKCVVDGAVQPWASAIVAGVGSYTERSPSGAGLHIWARGWWPTAGNRRGRVEIYASKRFMTVTGEHVAGTPEHIAEADLRPLQRCLAHAGKNGSLATSAKELCSRLQLPNQAPEPLAPECLQHLASKYPQLRRILAGAYDSLSERDLALARFARLAGRPAADAWALMITVRSDGKAKRADYAAWTIGRVYVDAS